MARSITTDLEDLFEPRYSSQHEYISNATKADLDWSNIRLRNLTWFFNQNPEFYQSLLDAWEEVVGKGHTKNTKDDIPDLIRATQMYALQAPIFWGIQKNGNIILYCGSKRIVQEVSGDWLKSAFNANRKGKVFALKLEIADMTRDNTRYQMLYQGELKLANSAETSVTADTVIIPGESTLTVVDGILEGLKAGKTLKVSQGGQIEKVRLISGNPQVLNKIGGNAGIARQVADGLGLMLNPGDFRFWAPSVNAPAMSSGLTNVKIAELDSVEEVTDDKVQGVAKELGISPESSEESFLTDQVGMWFISSVCEQKSASKEAKVLRVLNNLGAELDEAKKNEDGLYGFRVLAEGYKKLTPENQKKFVENLPMGYLEAANSVRGMLKNPKDINPSEVTGYLNDSVVQIVYQRKNGSISSMICSNSDEVMRRMYGDGYFGRVESQGVRLREFERRIEAGEDWDDAARYCGFTYSVGIPAEEREENLEQLRSSYSPKKSTKPEGFIYVRKLFATMSGGTVNYYAMVNPERVLSARVFQG